jgi:hypothetical protein
MTETIRLRVKPALIPLNATVEVGDTTTLAAGEDATVTNSGTSSAVVLDFGIPAGETGPTGPAGTNGTNGTNGADGADGVDGIMASVVAGSGIDVDATDPANPIVSVEANLQEYNAVNPTAAGLALLDDANAAAQLVTLGFTATVTELNFTDGVTSAIQTQLDAKQPLDADLTTWAGLTPSANAQSLVTAANYAAMRALLDLEAGTDFYSIAAADAAFQPIDADLTSWAGVTRAAGFDTFVATPSSANLASLVTGETGSGALMFGTSPSVTTDIRPASNDGASLGISGTAFADLFLASGGVINWNAGNATITHSAGLLTSNVAFSVGTSLAITAGTIELGAASDTTISRSAAGVIAVEGVPLYPNIPQNSQSAAYTTVLADAQKHILHPTADNNARTFTIDSNANVPYPIGTAITFINEINTVTIAITSDTLVFAGSGSTGSRTLAAMGMATAIKKTTTSWIISGPGLT